MDKLYTEVSHSRDDCVTVNSNAERTQAVKEAFELLGKIEPEAVLGYLIVVIAKPDEEGHSEANVMSGGDGVVKAVVADLAVKHFQCQSARDQH